MDASVCLTNSARLCQELRDYAGAQGLSPEMRDSRPRVISEGLLLSHATSLQKMRRVADSRELLSQREVARRTGKTQMAQTTETLLGTDDDVFFFLAPFRYPHTHCGLLFGRSLEEHHAASASATPFDSGGLHDPPKCLRPDPSEPVAAFLARHQLPIPEHRVYLELTLTILFASPWDYIEGVDPRTAGPIGLTGGDARRWTHEVRIPTAVPLDRNHLKALFVSVAAVEGDAEIGLLDEWCRGQAIDTVYIDTPGRDDFEALRRQSISYLRQRLQ